MKVNKIVVAFFLVISMVSCKKDESKPEEVKKADAYSFTINAIVQKDDAFQIFFKEDNDPQAPFEEVNSVIVNISGSEAAQDIVFQMPEGVFPTNIRLDFGQNKEQKEIAVKSFKVSYKDKSFTTGGPDFFNYVIPEETFVKVDKEGAKALPVITDGGVYDPMFFSNDALNQELVKLVQ